MNCDSFYRVTKVLGDTDFVDLKMRFALELWLVVLGHVLFSGDFYFPYYIDLTHIEMYCVLHLCDLLFCGN